MSFDAGKAKSNLSDHDNAIEEAQSCMCGVCHSCGFDPVEMRATLAEIERLQAVKEHQAVRIRELEGWLSDHVVEGNNMILTKEQREAVDFAVRWFDDDPCEFLLSPIGLGYRDALRSLLYSKNPACWEATEERKAALSDALYWIPTPKCGASAEVLRRMLEEARP